MGAWIFTMNFLLASAGRCTAGALPSFHCGPFLVAFFICLADMFHGICIYIETETTKEFNVRINIGNRTEQLIIGLGRGCWPAVDSFFICLCELL
jgi:hypothetical protein